MSNSEIDILLQIIDQAFDHRSWHGTNLRGSLRGLAVQQAVWRPQPARHNIWEIVLHAAYWKYTVRRRLLGEKRGSFPLKGSDWFKPTETTEKDWRQAVKLLADTHASLRTAIAALDSKQLRNTLPGSKDTYLFLISGVAAHDVYHAGQIQLLKRMQSGK